MAARIQPPFRFPQTFQFKAPFKLAEVRGRISFCESRRGREFGPDFGSKSVRASGADPASSRCHLPDGPRVRGVGREHRRGEDPRLRGPCCRAACASCAGRGRGRGRGSFPDLRVSPCEWNTCPDSDARLVMLAAAHCAGSGSSGSEISATATTTGNNTTSSNSNSTTSSDDSAGSTIASHSPSLHFTLHSPNYSDAPSTHTISSHSPSPSAVVQSPAHNHPSLQSPTPTVSLTCSTLWAWKDPVSPHLAARESRAANTRPLTW
ncbi:unnamed protein product [Closterium sp. NIES-53]